ncbi:MAG: hypothetical protein Q4G69_09875 [Planctomycetia bacterium]|nr:hypothetical protein [Planctomycetia bacterium]
MRKSPFFLCVICLLSLLLIAPSFGKETKIRSEFPESGWKVEDPNLGKITKQWDPSRWTDPQGKEFRFELDGDQDQKPVFRVRLGKLGLADALITMEYPGRSLSWKGMRIWCFGVPIYELSTGPFVLSEKEGIWKQTVRKGEKEITLFYDFGKEQDAFFVRINCSDPDYFSRIEAGPGDRSVSKLYMGHGYCITDPGKYSAKSDAHRFSTSFAGFDYENGLSVVMGTDFLIDFLTLDPVSKQNGISVDQPSKLIFVPGRTDQGGSMQCAIRYRFHDKRKAGSGVAAKQGRFVVDIWNGKFAEHTEFIKKAVEYGLKDDLMFVSHNWQGYGYDNQLPDIYPPNPLFGTPEEMKTVLKTARDNGWRFGVHTNVIDYYPEASTFSWDNAAFNPDGTPRKAYINVFRNCQSYRLAPDKAPAVMKESLVDPVRDHFLIDTCFVDVLGSNGSYTTSPWFDRKGNFYNRTEGAGGMAAVFDAIHDFLDPALKKSGVDIPSITLSEAGHDFLIGHLDGADCQYMNLTKDHGEYCWFCYPEYTDAEKIPWFDAVNHKKFSLHGAGYSIRFESGRGYLFHGIDSDDYISTEILTGHALMSDGYCRDVKEVLEGYVRSMDMPKSLRQTVRKYWLAQAFARSIGNDEIVQHQFVDGDIHRQIVRWKSGAIVYVNRGKSDWKVEGITLPQYGYLARNKKAGIESMIHRIDGRVVEQSSWKEGEKQIRYVNARNGKQDKLLAIIPAASASQVKDQNSVHMKVDWKRFGNQPIPKEKFQISFYLTKRRGAETGKVPDFLLKTVEADLSKPLELDLTFPEKGIKGKFDILFTAVPVGKEIDKVDNRLHFLTTPSFWSRYHLGVAEFANGKIGFTPFEQKDTDLYERALPPEKPIDFGFCKTKGGFRLEYLPGKAKPIITQLPNEEKTEIQISEE